MCMVVYLAADSSLPLIAWDEQNPAFNVTELSEYEQSVRGQFHKPYVYYLGSYTGCSCGFSPDSNGGAELAIKSQEALISYVAQAATSGAVELFVCWEGDWQESPKERLKFKLEEFREPERWYRELVFISIDTKSV